MSKKIAIIGSGLAAHHLTIALLNGQNNNIEIVNIDEQKTEKQITLEEPTMVITDPYKELRFEEPKKDGKTNRRERRKQERKNKKP